MGLERLLAWTGDDAADTRARKIRAFEGILALGLISEIHLAVYRGAALGGGVAERWAFVAAAGVASLVWVRWRRLGLAGLATIVAIGVVRSFPLTANHAFLQLFLLGFALWCSLEREAEQRLYLQSVRWLVATLFFYAGLHKLVHGYYFGGEYFAYSMGRESFASVLRYAMSEAELERFSELFQHRVGDGPYRFRNPAMLVLSNAAWVAELSIPALLLVSRTRAFGVALGCGFIVVTEAMAREFHFGALFVAGLLLYLPAGVLLAARAPFALFFLWMALTGSGALPGVVFY